MVLNVHCRHQLRQLHDDLPSALCVAITTEGDHMKKTNTLLILVLLVLSILWNIFMRTELAECQDANKKTERSIEMICSLPFVECGTKDYFNRT